MKHFSHAGSIPAISTFKTLAPFWRFLFYSGDEQGVCTPCGRESKGGAIIALAIGEPGEEPHNILGILGLKY